MGLIQKAILEMNMKLKSINRPDIQMKATQLQNA